MENAYLEAQYRCREGFEMHLDGNSSARVFCRHRSWIGQTPKCIKIETTVLVKRLEKTCDQKECDQLCFVDDNGNETCSCFRGFRMVDGFCTGEFFNLFSRRFMSSTVPFFPVLKISMNAPKVSPLVNLNATILQGRSDANAPKD